MKRPILILSSILCLYGIAPVIASDTLEEEEIVVDSVEEAEPATTEVVEEEVVEEEVVEDEIPDDDNVTVVDAEYVHEFMDEFAETRARIGELLIPRGSVQNVWTEDGYFSNSGSEQTVVLNPMDNKKFKNGTVTFDGQNYYGETVYIINNFLSGDAGNVSATSGKFSRRMNAQYKDCPFQSVSECEVWMRKPIVSEVVAPRSTTLRESVMTNITDAIEQKPTISANSKVMRPLLQRYKVLMRASQSCCTGGLTYQLQKDGTAQKDIYKFLSDDANFTGFGSRCLVMTDEQIEGSDSRDAPFDIVSDVRNECLCKSKESMRALLAPFEQLYKQYPDFANAPFEYKHHDGLGRAVTDSVNADVQNVLNQLEMCP